MAALAQKCVVGVDVERINGQDCDLSIALSKQEKQHLSGMVPGERSLAILRIWTVKEAVAKLVGLGLSLDLTSFSVLPREDSLQVCFSLDFPFLLRKPRLFQARVCIGGDWYLLSLAIATHVGTRKKEKNGINGPLIRIPVREICI